MRYHCDECGRGSSFSGTTKQHRTTLRAERRALRPKPERNEIRIDTRPASAESTAGSKPRATRVAAKPSAAALPLLGSKPAEGRPAKPSAGTRPLLNMLISKSAQKKRKNADLATKVAQSTAPAPKATGLSRLYGELESVLK